MEFPACLFNVPKNFADENTEYHSLWTKNSTNNEPNEKKQIKDLSI